MFTIETRTIVPTTPHNVPRCDAIITTRSSPREMHVLQQDRAKKIIETPIPACDNAMDKGILQLTPETTILQSNDTAVCKKDASQDNELDFDRSSTQAKNISHRSCWHRNDHQRSSSNPPRRKVFTQYWDKTTKQEFPQESSCTTRPTVSEGRYPYSEVDIRNFSPPPELCGSLRDYHSLVDEYPNGEVPSKYLLPPLPTPLRRWTSTSKNHQNKGMYPMLMPKSILRHNRRWKSICDSKADQDEVDRHKSLGRTLSLELRCSFGSPRLESSLSKHIVQLGDDEITKSLERAKQEKGRHTHFDPRIVITKFDDNVPRHWYSEEELTEFKCETILQAKQYMLMHPELIEEFDTPLTCPVTGKVRKRALYSIPVLNSLPDEPDEISNERDRLDVMVQQGVQKILIVDSNKAILKLFCKGLQCMFPDAQLFLAQTGEEALKLYRDMSKRRHSKKEDFRVYDIIIVEERLNRPEQQSAGMSPDPLDDRGAKRNRLKNSMANIHALWKAANPMGGHIARQSFLSYFDRKDNNGAEGRCISGSDLIREIRQLENEVYGRHCVSMQNGDDEHASQTHTIESDTEGSHCRALVIGVSVNKDRDEEILRKCGADVVWGKPPPGMGIALRNQIVRALIIKRQIPDLPKTPKARIKCTADMS